MLAVHIGTLLHLVLQLTVNCHISNLFYTVQTYYTHKNVIYVKHKYGSGLRSEGINSCRISIIILDVRKQLTSNASRFFSFHILYISLRENIITSNEKERVGNSGRPIDSCVDEETNLYRILQLRFIHRGIITLRQQPSYLSHTYAYKSKDC